MLYSQCYNFVAVNANTRERRPCKGYHLPFIIMVPNSRFFAYVYSYQIRMIFIQIYLTHRRKPNVYNKKYHIEYYNKKRDDSCCLNMKMLYTQCYNFVAVNTNPMERRPFKANQCNSLPKWYQIVVSIT